MEASSNQRIFVTLPWNCTVIVSVLEGWIGLDSQSQQGLFQAVEVASFRLM